MASKPSEKYRTEKKTVPDPGFCKSCGWYFESWASFYTGCGWCARHEKVRRPDDRICAEFGTEEEVCEEILEGIWNRIRARRPSWDEFRRWLGSDTGSDKNLRGFLRKNKGKNCGVIENQGIPGKTDGVSGKGPDRFPERKAPVTKNVRSCGVTENQGVRRIRPFEASTLSVRIGRLLLREARDTVKDPEKEKNCGVVDNQRIRLI